MSSSTPLLNDRLKLGLGCSRLGSVNGASADEARELLLAAHEGGMRVFDTSNIYGQGDSERLIGQTVSQRDGTVIISKAGKYVSVKRRVLVPLKSVLRSATRRSDGARERVTAARSKPMPTRWDSAQLTKSLEGSLRRLQREHIDVFMLHSPPLQVIEAGDAVDTLDRARVAGKIGLVGVSVDDVASANAALSDTRVSAIQLPIHPDANAYDEVLEAANEQQVIVIAREIFGGASHMSVVADPVAFAHRRVSDLVVDPRLNLSLVGTTRVGNLLASLNAATEALAQGPRGVRDEG